MQAHRQLSMGFAIRLVKYHFLELDQKYCLVSMDPKRLMDNAGPDGAISLAVVILQGQNL